MSKLKLQLERELGQVAVKNLEGELAKAAAVALLAKGSSISDLEILFIQRAHHEHDRWSGQIGFPGGKRDAEETLMAAALRETHEEIGLPVEEADCVGRLSDLQARSRSGMMDFFIRPFVFLINEPSQISLNEREVSDVFWVPYRDLIRPENKRIYELKAEGNQVELPSILLPNKRVLWGLSYLMFQDFYFRLSSNRVS